MSHTKPAPFQEWIWSRFLSPPRTVTVSQAADALREAKTVLLVKLDRGAADLLAQTPLLHNLRRYLPRARILFLGDSASAPLMEGHPDIDSLHRLSLNEALAPFRAFSLVRKLRSAPIDVCIPLGADRTTVSFARRCRPRMVVGMSEGQPGFDCVVAPPEDTRIHIVDYHLAFLETLGVPVGGREHRLGVRASAVAAARERLHEAGLDPGKPIFGAHVGGIPDRPDRQWPPSHYAAVLQRAAGEMGFQPLILGDDRDRPTVKQVQALGKTPIPAILDLDITGYKAMLSLLRFFITHDGEPVQIAAGMGVSSFFVFLSTPAWRWAPYGSHVGVWEESRPGHVPPSAEVWARVKAMLEEDRG